MQGDVQDRKPPPLLVALSNIFLKAILRTPVARVITPMALLSFAGRRSGRSLSVVVGWHTLDGVATVFTPASWKANFTDPTPATVRHRHHRLHLVGTLTTDPTRVADALNRLIRSGTSPGKLALHVPTGYKITASDVTAVRRSMIQFSNAAATAAD
ncbi:MAG: hypothetical protein ABI894_15160 [Ilumatobacteraceae bacterium]